MPLRSVPLSKAKAGVPVELGVEGKNTAETVEPSLAGSAADVIEAERFGAIAPRAQIKWNKYRTLKIASG
ncbi:hypothetical protein [Massilia glaciei]|uniref:hypothetical protein n=1 Tax=Massilia glaciei TaxID=1524097 RepID=UPI0015E80AB9|nr:hypothetical protein [Massilia glaciei]